MSMIQSSYFDYRHTADYGVITLRLTQLSEEENLEQIDQEWTALIDKNHIQQLVVDLSSVRFMTSAAIAKLIGLHRRMIRQSGQLVLCSLQPEVELSLSTSHLLTYFKVTADAESAIALLSENS